ncbi:MULTISPECIES: hypothetical protein [unclassified Streptomyces]|uniref:hypothetical protein n=1 Tax=unclassified Streptomyces TaxID=2593676 RepID=UPI0029C058C6|nr:hypothetical protein [Streptomyces sp. PA03-2a]
MRASPAPRAAGRCTFGGSRRSPARWARRRPRPAGAAAPDSAEPYVQAERLFFREPLHQLTADWTTYRSHRWPASSNPHLLVSRKSAVDPDHPAVSIGALSGALPRGLTLSGLRQDRILNEPAESADPLKLMRLFGIIEQTATRYVTAAHPERTAELPKWPTWFSPGGWRASRSAGG